MLGKLFSLGAGPGGMAPSGQSPSNRAVSSLESVQEDEHTRNLLFPDPQDLYEHRLDEVFPLSTGTSLPLASSINTFDYHGDIELEARDVRIIIMQDALSSVTASLLYDSQAPPPLPTSPVDRPTTAGPVHFTSHQDSRRTPTSPRKPSLGHAQRPVIIQPDSPGIRQGAFDRRPSIHGRHQSHVESDAQRAWREYREELATFSSCIFGNSELMAYKGTSTKVHLVPSDTRPTETPNLGDGRGSLGRSSLRSSRLSQSFSSENPPPFQTTPAPGTPTRASEKKKVLITRLFPVTLPTDEEPVMTPVSRFSEDNSGFPFPHASDELRAKKKKPQVKQKRTPMYAVALVITLPQAASQTTAFSSRSLFRGSGSFNEPDTLPSSYNSARPSPWTMFGSTLPVDLEQSVSSDVEDPMEAITQHWDIIMRTVTRLQAVATATLYTLLKQADLASPDPFPASVPSVSAQLARTPSLSGRRSEDGAPYKPPKTNAKLVTLLPNCLLDNRHVNAEVEVARSRIVAGLRATRVVTGQNRWPIWREEARWVAKRLGGKEQGFFFFNLLTGFLATHTDWLQALSPSSYRRRYLVQQKDKSVEDTLVSARTIVVAQDKMTARRLIFLLSAFLPASQQFPTVRAHRPSTSASLGGAFSQSPPSFVVPILKEESLRRKINRRGGPRRASHSRNLSQQSQHTRSGAVPGYLAHLSMESRHERRPSDTASIKTTNLPITGLAGADAATRKSSAATTATVTAETSIPHFSTLQRSDNFSHHRPGSSSSLATDDLRRLAREDSNGSDSRQNSRWSVISGLWNTRRRDSTSITVPPRSPSVRDSIRSPTKIAQPGKADTPSRGLIEPTLSESPKGGLVDTSGLPPRSQPNTPPPQYQENGAHTQVPPANVPPKPHRVPNPSGAYDSPVKTSINLDDGVIDVDVPFPDYITASFDTAVSSPSSSGYLSTPGFGTVLDSFEQACRVSVDGDTPVNVAGWLQGYHPDFALQAVPPHPNLVEQIKASMRAEPSPALWTAASSDSTHAATERWMDISTALIADATTMTINRLRYRRLVRAKLPADRSHSLLSGSVGSYNSTSTALLTPGPPSIATPFDAQEDEFILEPVVVLDELLSAAVERVIAIGQPAPGSETASTEPSSRSTSHHRRGDRMEGRERSNSASTGAESEEARYSEARGAEVPRSRCKKVVLSALEEVVREVIEQRDHEKEIGRRVGGSRENENLLRGAVMEWLDVVDAAND